MVQVREAVLAHLDPLCAEHVEIQVVHGARVHVNDITVLPCIRHVEYHLSGQREPLDGLLVALRGRMGPHAKEEPLLLVKNEGKLALLDHHLGVKGEGGVEEDGVVSGDCKIVHHHWLGNVDGHRLDELSGGVDDAVGAVGAALEIVPKEVHEAGGVVHLGVSGEGLHLSKADPLDCLHGALAEDLQRVGHVPLVQREEALGVVHHRGVGGAAAISDDAQDPLHSAQRETHEPANTCEIAKLPRRRPPNCLLLQVALRLDPFVGVRDLAVLDAASVHHAVAIEPVIAAEGAILRIRPGPQETPGQVRRQLALHLQLRLVDFRGHGAEVPLEILVRRSAFGVAQQIVQRNLQVVERPAE
mmetsp:Transcript_6206/g.16028  ORF Transcript_6206/g.16028 Transcript_6206/m.16028 type:complete len:358 (-) Transcript_6206:248-1321(-)